MTRNLTALPPVSPAITSMATSPTEPADVSDPGLYAPLTQQERNVLSYHLKSGWYKQGAIYPCLALAWWETAALLHDIHLASEAHYSAGDAA